MQASLARELDADVIVPIEIDVPTQNHETPWLSDDGSVSWNRRSAGQGH